MDPEILRHDRARATIYRSAASWGSQKTAAVGKFQCESAEAGATLLAEISEVLRTEGYGALIGPMEGDTWHSYRLVSESDGTAPFLMEPTSGPHDRAAFQAAGFEDIAHYFSARVPVETALGNAPEPLEDVLIETWDGEDPEAHFSDVHALSTTAFAQNLFYAPISRAAFLEMYMPFVPLLKRDLILMARDAGNGDLLGFLFGIPNYAEGPQPESVILKTYASLRPGVGHRLSHAFHQAAQAMSFKTVLHALIHDDNTSARRSRQHGADVFRRYALMGRRLDG